MKITITYRRTRRIRRSNLTEIVRVIRWQITKDRIHELLPICSKFQRHKTNQNSEEKKLKNHEHE